MNNFLQHIVAGVAPAQRLSHSRLQPILGSVFAPISQVGMHEEPADPFNFSETAEYRSQTTELGGSAASPANLHGSLLSPAPSDYPTSVVPHSSVQHYWPLLPQDVTPRGDRNAARVADAVAPESGDTFGHMTREESPSRTAHASLTSTATGDNSQAASNPFSQRLQPLLASAPLVPSRIVPMRPAPPEPQRQVHREPDEIHIHIGRIDVAAVSPSTPRAPAPQPRKSLSLDEYLRRGRGGHR